MVSILILSLIIGLPMVAGIMLYIERDWVSESEADNSVSEWDPHPNVRYVGKVEKISHREYEKHVYIEHARLQSWLPRNRMVINLDAITYDKPTRVIAIVTDGTDGTVYNIQEYASGKTSAIPVITDDIIGLDYNGNPVHLNN